MGKYIGVFVVVVLALYLVIPKGDNSLENLGVQTDSKKEDEVEIKVINNNKAQEKKEELHVNKTEVKKEEKKVSQNIKEDIYDETKVFTQGDKDNIKGYQAVYEHIQENNLEAVYNEPKVLDDGSLLNVYVPKKEESENNSFTPPIVPSFVSTTINGQKVSFVVPGGTTKAFVTTTEKESGNTEGKELDTTPPSQNESEQNSENSSQSQEKVEIIAPPQIGVNQ